MDLNQVISKDRIQKYHKDFERIKSSKVLQKFTFLRIHFNRTIQSAIIILSNPFIWRYVIQGFFRTVLGKRCLRSLEVAVTYRCNARCEQCSCRIDYNKDEEKNKKLSINEFKNTIDQAVELGAFQFSINGGEPMLEEETVFELIKYIKKYHKRFVMLCTNGISLNEQKISKLKECGLDGIEMGFDSAFEHVHDNNRVKGSYKKIFENIHNCKKYNIRVSLNLLFAFIPLCTIQVMFKKTGAFVSTLQKY